MEQATDPTPRPPEDVERFAKLLLVAHKAARLYPATSDIPRESAELLLQALNAALRNRPDLRLGVTKEHLLHDSAPLLPGRDSFEALARDLYSRHVAEVRFHPGTSVKGLLDFLSVVREEPEAVAYAGGFEQRLWDLHVDGISVFELTTVVIDAEASAADDDSAWPPSGARVTELLESRHERRPDERRVLIKFMRDPALVAGYLREVAETEQPDDAVAAVASRTAALSQVASSEVTTESAALLRSVVEGLLGLEPDVLRAVMAERLLPEARVDDAVAETVRQFKLEELCGALAAGSGVGTISHDGLSRAIRNLVAISMRPRGEVIQAAVASMRAEGMSEQGIVAVLENVAPSALSLDAAESGHDPEIEQTLRLLDLAPTVDDGEDAGVAALKEEARTGVSDGDVLMSIVTLATIERQPDTFSSLMSVVEYGLGLLLDWGDHAASADAIRALDALVADEALDAAETRRVQTALATTASASRIRGVSAAMRVHPTGSQEHDACRRVLVLLGGYAMTPLLDALAEEPDMAGRKALVEILSEIAQPQMQVLAAHVSDPRWYFVRNVVNILGSTRSPEALAPLSRTIRHADARVRRESIRAVGGIRDRRAGELLVAVLHDEDAQNVGLAARYLGTLRVTAALPALAAVATGEGAGSRETSARLEAIEALGRLGVPEAGKVLEGIAHRKSLLRQSQAGALRLAAAAALAELDRTSHERDG